MASVESILQRVRMQLGDNAEPFRETYRGTNTQDEFDLPVVRISRASLHVFTVDGATITDLALDTDYTLDPETGVLRLNAGPLAKDVLLVAEGSAFGMFTDEELAHFVGDALLQHTNESYDSVRYRDANGFIRFERIKQDADNLPEVEELPVSMLATIEALWALSTDAATDIDITTSEGTQISRGQRFVQLQTQIQLLTDKYKELCAMLNVGLWRIEVMNLRRVSRTTGRLVPVYVEREYDDHSSPTRITPPIDARDADFDGPPSAANQGLY